jgi:hypothetical protein
MSEKKLRLVLTSAVIAASLCLTVAADAGATERSRWHGRSSERAEHRWEIPFLDLLTRLWSKSGVRIDPEGQTQKSGVRIDPEGLAEKQRANIDAEGGH